MGWIGWIQEYLQTLETDENTFVFRLAFAAICLAAVAFLSEVTVLFVYCKRQRIKRKKERAERARKLQFTLPDKDNSFLRARLNGVLKTPAPDEILQDPFEEDGVRFEYVQEMLTKICSAALTAADRLSLEETAKLFKTVSMRAKWSEKDVRIMNDCCLSMLKLSAKYAV